MEPADMEHGVSPDPLSQHTEEIWLIQFTRTPSEFTQALCTGPELAGTRNMLADRGFNTRLDSGAKVLVWPDQFSQVLEHIEDNELTLASSHVIISDSLLTDLDMATAGIPSRRNVKKKSKSLFFTWRGPQWYEHQAVIPTSTRRIGRRQKRSRNATQSISRTPKHSRLATDFDDYEGLIGGTDLPETNTDT